jgi:hypothetical protein
VKILSKELLQKNRAEEKAMTKCAKCGKEIGIFDTIISRSSEGNKISFCPDCYKIEDEERKKSFEEKKIPLNEHSEANVKGKSLYHLEMLFLIPIDELKNADRKTIKKKNKQINKFSENAKNILEAHAVSTISKLPIPGTSMVGYYPIRFEESILANEFKDIQEKCLSDNYYPIALTNRTMASRDKNFPNLIEKRFEKLMAEFEKFAKKRQIDFDMNCQVYETEREYQGLIKGSKPIGMNIVLTYTRSFKRNV